MTAGFVLPCYDLASVRKRDGALRHDTVSLNARHLRVSRERNAAVGRPEGQAKRQIVLSGLFLLLRPPPTSLSI